MARRTSNSTGRILMKTKSRDLSFDVGHDRALAESVVEQFSKLKRPVFVPQYDPTSSPNPYAAFYKQPLADGVHSAQVSHLGEVSWACSGSGVQTRIGEGWLPLYASVEGLSRVEALCRLMQRFDIDQGGLLERSHEDVVKPFEERGCHIPAKEIELFGEQVSFVDQLYVRNALGDAELAVAIGATSSREVVHLPYYLAGHVSDPYRANGVSCWGFPTKRTPLYGLEVLENSPGAGVVLVDDLWLASELNKVFKETGDGLVALAFWTGCSRILDCNYKPLMGRDVVYIPTLNRDAIKAGIILRERLKDSKVAEFRVLMRPWTFVKRLENFNMEECGEYACQNAVTFSRREAYCLADDIEDAWEFKRFKHYCVQVGFLEEETHGHVSEMFRSVVGQQRTSSKQELAFDQLLHPSQTMCVVGDSDTGKSLFVKTLAVAIAEGKSVFGIKASAPRRVYLLNIEQHQETACAYLDRVCDALGLDSAPENLFERAELESDLPGWKTSIGFQNENWHREVLAAVAPGSVLIIDNLLAASEKSIGHSGVAQKMMRFSKQLADKMVSLVLVHHTGKNGNPMGSKGLENLAQSFLLIHRTEVKKGFEGGVNALISFRKIKSFPPYRGKQFDLRLEYSDVLGEGGPWVFEEIEGGESSSHEERAVEASSTPPDVAGLSPIQTDILTLAQKNGRVTRKELREEGHKDATVKENLAKLVSGGKLLKEGVGKATHYRLPN